MPTHQELRRHFALVDAAFTFVASHRATPTVRSVLKVANSFGSSHLTFDDLQQLKNVAPELLVLEEPTAKSAEDVFSPAATASEDLEVVTFPLAPQTSQRASTKRKQLFDAALKKNAEKDPIQATPSPEAVPSNAVPKLTKTSAAKQPHNNWGSSVLTMLQQLDSYRDQIVHVERRNARIAQYRDLEALQFSPRVCEALQKCYGITQLYSHQFEAIEAIQRGESAVLSTATASGKSLAYNVPMLDMLIEDPAATFMYLFPTKALAQDQLKSLRNLLSAADFPLHLGATFDGDTAMKSRSMVIRETRIFLTNPDMLHLTILPQHTQWKNVLSNLRLLVVDEAHMYRGVFGSHVACVFRRLFRLCALYGSNPQVVCCSATIKNPAEHFRQLLPSLPPRYITTSSSEEQMDANSGCGPSNLHFFRQRPLKVITHDGAPSIEKLFCVWNPKQSKQEEEREEETGQNDGRSASAVCPTKRKRSEDNPSDNFDPSTEKTAAKTSTSAIFQGAQILSRLVEAQVATLLFCRGRKLTELVLMNVHSIMKAGQGTQSLLRRVSSYRGGYTLEARRRIEQRLFSGDLLGVVATNALELGIDIGELDCTIHLGLPSSIASLWQQAGRAGRRQESKEKQSVAIIVCFDSPLDQHFAQKQHAAELFRLEPEAVSLNPMNCRVLGQHLLCAAREAALYSSRSGTDYIDSYVFGQLPCQNPNRDGNANCDSHQTTNSEMLDVLKPLVNENKLMKSPEPGGHSCYRIHSCMPKKFRAVNLRSICEENYAVLVPGSNVNDEIGSGEVLDEIPGDKAFFQVYPTAVYLHQAQEYLITRLDNVQRIAFAKACPEPLKYFTTCRDFTDIEVVRIHSTTRFGNTSEVKPDPVLLRVGTVSILTRVVGSTKLEKRSMRVLGTNEFSLPPMQSFGEALWLEFPASLRDEVEALGHVSWTAALHGVGHLFAAVLRLFVLCDSTDIGTEHINEFERRVKPNRVTLFERREGGSGLVPEIVKVLPKIVEKAWTIASECTCEKGCPGCIQSAECSEFNVVLDKRGSLHVLAFLHSLTESTSKDTPHWRTR